MHVSSLKDLSRLEESIGYTFKNEAIIHEAITHKSYAHERKKKCLVFNERMEFLGDAVLELIISEYLFSSFPDYTEADLSRIKAYVVQESTLAAIAKNLGIGSFLLLGKGEERTGGRKKSSLLANAFEAVLAAIYIDGGYRKAKKFILSNIKSRIEEHTDKNFIFDFKTKFQEVAQAEFGELPTYLIHSEKGPEHKKMFEVKVYINEKIFGSGKGRTKKAAAQKAAEAGLKKVRKIHEINV